MTKKTSLYFFSFSPLETKNVAAKVVELLGWDRTMFLIGDLGSGKTTFVKGIAEKANLGGELSSPSFTLVNEYKNSNFQVIHIDLYRLERSEIETIFIDELLASNGLKVVEWADKLPKIEEYDGVVKVFFRIIGDTERLVKVSF